MSGLIPEVWAESLRDMLTPGPFEERFFYEPRRQWHLIWSLGQRPCNYRDHDDERYSPDDACEGCGAVL